MFYVLVLPATGLYVMYVRAGKKSRFLCSCLDGSTKLIVDMPRVCRVLDTFNRICKPSVDQAMPSTIPRSQKIMSFEIST
ncbi:hypothetical protein FB192DRAFT_1406139 [Mucor lusitanicus]|uniref:Uncharacterized protein n=1 Tax=Mucor circinelloides f. lusitanicus TaxID=29924 RepID=A0A8H4B794_MUCCL|nr:hypothetical protein FB192DRAFT_1406139 [Mucor lusitanicus]